MTNYECCYTSGKQFVFTERRQWAFGMVLLVACVGLISGLVVAVTVSFAGEFAFNVFLLTGAGFATIHAYYLLFHRMSSSFDLSGYVLIILLVGAILIAIWLAVHYSLLLNLGVQKRCVLFSVIGVVVGLFMYLLVLVCLSEDERKHHLSIMENGQIAVVSPSSDTSDNSWKAQVQRYFAFIFRYHWIGFRFGGNEIGQEEDCAAADRIMVHNRTLKLIKVCFYASDDVFSWIPYGGISGSCVGLIHSEQVRAFSPPRSWQLRNGGLKLKVFQPQLFDKELACFPNVLLGQTLAFDDVEGMFKRSRLLSASPTSKPPSLVRRGSLESSESEFEGSGLVAPLDDSPSAGRDAGGGGGGMLKRSNNSASELHQRPNRLQLSGSSPTSSPNSAHLEARRAAPNEVVVRNRSGQEIRALLFRSTDYSFMVPLIGKILSCGDCILPDMERRFNPTNADEKFTVKVYSVGPGAKELTYLTVERGQVYTFCDSLLS